MKKILVLLLLPLLFSISCLHSRTTGPMFTVNRTLRVDHGNAVLRISGMVTEDLFRGNPFDNKTRDKNSFDNPFVREGSITKNETINLSANEEYRFSVLPTEVVNINIRSLDGNDVVITVFEGSTKRKHTIKGADRMGLFLSFQNR